MGHDEADACTSNLYSFAYFRSNPALQDLNHFNPYIVFQ